ncbi:MAG: NifB/NifX family molybdenum-iron cluster-binding protein [Actinobacteria bacterium]|nr:NifB/NifX family molybdenum-iron cluster-binding protein [Actinomycetota bacterium]MCG2818855.1 NifB/NifX family molybdenum-iron cluster-binding protein [Actinomycetes bacterium]MBU4218669.1 NifB/NifX family molybdenum-iron cluster-binding protein [Actinomycetota bacterium]MBU4360192.1 NifB/NifX family molybdenum-iron cluster-binding protein [Actinomycetota bacterium]MBU4393061.1 NifB/NifX family molybdenum-iron cluster-binding protein [Actinomycetota bacterium]
MKVAIAVEGNQVSEHFGRCRGFLLVTIEDEEIKSRDLVEAPPHEEGVLPKLLADNGVDCLIAGGMGRRAQQFLAEAGIEVYGGVKGSIEDALSNFLLKSLESGGGACEGGKGTCEQH